MGCSVHYLHLTQVRNVQLWFHLTEGAPICEWSLYLYDSEKHLGHTLSSTFQKRKSCTETQSQGSSSSDMPYWLLLCL